MSNSLLSINTKTYKSIVDQSLLEHKLLALKAAAHQFDSVYLRISHCVYLDLLDINVLGSRHNDINRIKSNLHVHLHELAEFIRSTDKKAIGKPPKDVFEMFELIGEFIDNSNTMEKFIEKFNTEKFGPAVKSTRETLSQLERASETPPYNFPSIRSGFRPMKPVLTIADQLKHKDAEIKSLRQQLRESETQKRDLEVASKNAINQYRKLREQLGHLLQ